MTGSHPAPAPPQPMSPQEASRRQAAYAAARREWAERAGRPYKDDLDSRPPPGELDAEAEE